MAPNLAWQLQWRLLISGPILSQWPLFKQRWRVVLFGMLMQYVHGVFTQLAHRLHQPTAEPLHDVGFELTPVS